MPKGRRTAVMSGAVALVALAAGVGAYALTDAFGGADSREQRPEVTAVADGEETAEPPTAEEAAAAAKTFLTAWADGDPVAASAVTDDPAAAQSALTAFAEDLKIEELTVTPGVAGGDGAVPFTVRAVVAWGEEPEQRAEWSYDSALTVARGEVTGEAQVVWRPELLHPALKDGQRLEAGPAGEAPPVRALDRDGGELTAEEHPALAGILAELATRYEEHSGGTRGMEIRIVDAAGEPVQRVQKLADPEPGEVPTTIDPEVQRAAEEALKDTAHGALVALEPSTGAILAVVNTPADGFDTALQGSYAPGSTWKIVTAGMLIDAGLASPGAAHPCPKFFEHGGWKFQNINEMEIAGGTFAQSFSASCNTAFISQAPELTDEQLGEYARSAFGIGLTWNTGVPSMDGTVPVESDAQMAAQLIGQAGVRANPMVMASVAATASTGTFRQPHLVPPDFDGRQLAQARGLSAETSQSLRQLMNLTATSGTAAAAMAGLSGDIGAKTGSAEVMDQEKPNAWFTAFRGDLAVAAVVPESGHGGTVAGPLVAEVLRNAG
ncbi:penicillin-binding transpeptidase domain-containing protein [Streptomyces sp. YIM 98790]|uniref:penicillin-binding transpeptidase domain-containing protein n=1 Tax=Streptomyces sp. YIM 98790 TaxID=2689077 RepID=UPI001408A94E|nr:penicillin-binding transpeptidase domain-containing protein [Streptomyces sp. YIM 98790]